MKNISMSTLKNLWEKFANIPVNNNDEIEEDFIIDSNNVFEKGTCKLDIWKWFDDKCENNLHDDLMFSN